MLRLRRRLSPLTIRVACHLAAAAPFAAACGYEMAHGWAPQGDDGVIVFRSWAVLTAHSPLVGHYTHLTASHPVYAPGPLMYWLLTLPVHLDHLQGGLWGATLFCVVATSLAVEAAWSVLGWRAAVGVVAVVLATVFELPAIAVDPIWDPHIGLVWFICMAVVAWAVATGRLRWWPVLVLAASICAQIHLMFAVGALACLIVAPLVGLTRNRRLGWWIPTGLAVGLVCWIPPLVQQFTSSPGNISQLIRAQHAAGPTLGTTYGLRALAAAVGPHPIWWAQGRVQLLDRFRLERQILSHPPWIGIAVLVGLALCASLAWLTRRRYLAALALILFILSLATTWTTSSLPLSQNLSYIYIEPSSWPVGMGILLVGAWSAGEIVFAIARGAQQRRYIHTRPQPRLHTGRLSSTIKVTRLAGPLAASVILVVGAAAGVRAADAAANDNIPTSGWPVVRQVRVATRLIERTVPRGPLLVIAPQGFNYSYSAIAGIDWLLYADGWRPQSFPGYPDLMGPEVAPSRPPPPTTATVTYNGGPVDIVFSPTGQTGTRR